MPFKFLNTWNAHDRISKYDRVDQQAFVPYREESAKSLENTSDAEETMVENFITKYDVRQNTIRTVVFVLIATIVGTLLGLAGAWLLWDKRSLSTQSPVKEFAPQTIVKVPLGTVVFEEIPELYGPPSRETDAYWDSLVPPGKGFVQIPNPEEYNLKPGILTQTGVERYSVTMYHELHCLALIRRYYWHLVDSVSNGWHEDARQEMVREQLYNHHPHHCFAYLAQGIMCNADLTIEWARVEKDGRRFQVEGWGIPHHTCKDPRAVREWADKHHSPPRENSTHIDGSHG
ncbi:hypothetical protein MBLNU459_g7660t1 [Dothideomycetes sp. NU459]